MEEIVRKFLLSTHGSGSGDGDGSGHGYGSGDGYGHGDGSGYDLKTFNSQKVYLIDGIETLIHSIKENYALGSIINKDLTLSKTYISKVGKYFAHGETLKQSFLDAKEKFESNLSDEDKINLFFENFNKTDKYKASLFSEWHHKLTGSCKQGRESFMFSNGISEDSEYTVFEFIDKTKNSYNVNIIKKIELLLLA